ncbi:MAG: DUF484 family protein [Cypionkella sp.]
MIDPDTRDRILAEPEALLDDIDVMQALIGANERAMGSNIVDLRGIAMERLEQRLDRLEDTHRTVIAAAYENLAGTNQVHRAILQLLDPADFPAFLVALNGTIGSTLRVEKVRLVLESKAEGDSALGKLSDAIHIAPAGFVAEYLSAGRNTPTKSVLLRQVQPSSDAIYGDRAGWIRSEALLKLDLGAGRLPGLLALGAEDPHQFKATHGTDLLAFFAGVFERVMRKWLG